MPLQGYRCRFLFINPLINNGVLQAIDFDQALHQFILIVREAIGERK